MVRNEESLQIPPLAVFCFFLLKHGVFSSSMHLHFERGDVCHSRTWKASDKKAPCRPSDVEISELFSVDSQEAA